VSVDSVPPLYGRTLLHQLLLASLPYSPSAPLLFRGRQPMGDVLRANNLFFFAPGPPIAYTLVSFTVLQRAPGRRSPPIERRQPRTYGYLSPPVRAPRASHLPPPRACFQKQRLLTQADMGRLARCFFRRAPPLTSLPPCTTVFFGRMFPFFGPLTFPLDFVW